MTDDELLLIYKGLRDMTEAMKAREIALDAKTAALGAAITELKGLPLSLGKQTSQYIAMGVRQSIQDDFSRPIAEAVKGPIAEFNQATYYARDVMRQVGEDVRFRSRTWLAVFLLIGFGLGDTLGYFFFVQTTNRIDDRLSAIQQQITLTGLVPDAKPADGKMGKGKRGH